MALIAMSMSPTSRLVVLVLAAVLLLSLLVQHLPVRSGTSTTSFYTADTDNEDWDSPKELPLPKEELPLLLPEPEPEPVPFESELSETQIKTPTTAAPASLPSSVSSAQLAIITEPPRIPPSSYAFATFLSDTDAENPYEDHYYMGTRMLIYQLLHDPETRTTHGIPFIVLVSPGVTEEKRERLRFEGAQVIEFPSINFDWIEPGRPRWERVMDKLNVFRLTQFEKILLMDADIVILKPVDALFTDPETDLQQNLQLPNKTREDEGIQPQQYLMAGDSSPVGAANHAYPAPRTTKFNAGFVVIHPSEAMFDHYLQVAKIPNRFPGDAPENELWKYVHRLDGNMPFKQIQLEWTINSPILNDISHGIASVHDKYWRSGVAKGVKTWLLRSRFKMEGYWQYDGLAREANAQARRQRTAQ